MGREADDKLTEALRSVLAQLTDARRKAERLLDASFRRGPERLAPASRPVPPS